MVSGDDVQLPDLQVIQRYSLAVRGATAPVADVIQALQSDLAWLTRGGRRAAEPAKVSPPAKTAPAKTAAKKAPAKTAAKKAPAKTAAKKAPAKKPAARKPAAKKSGARRA